MLCAQQLQVRGLIQRADYTPDVPQKLWTLPSRPLPPGGPAWAPTARAGLRGQAAPVAAHGLFPVAQCAPDSSSLDCKVPSLRTSTELPCTDRV